MRFNLTSPRFRNKPQCRHLCLKNEHHPNKIDTHISRNLRINDVSKQRNSKKVYYETLELNQFGRTNGTGGNTLNNFK